MGRVVQGEEKRRGEEAQEEKVEEGKPSFT